MYLGHSNRGYSVAGNGGGNPGFNGQPNYSLSGTIAWDQSVTLSNASNPFGTNGPTFFGYDDGRVGGTALTAVADNTPLVTGTGKWRQYNGSGAGSALWGPAGSNAAGTGQAFRVLNNERAGGSVFGRKLQLYLGGATTGFYLFYNETWNPTLSNTSGAWNGANLEGGGGGYYKHDWFLTTTAAQGYGPPNFDLIPWDFYCEASDNMMPHILSAVWSSAGGGTVTVTVDGSYDLTHYCAIGNTFTAPMGISTSGNNTPTSFAPAGYNGSFTATVQSASQFTFPLATNPGSAATAIGSCPQPGGAGTNVMSPSTFNGMGGNSSSYLGLPGAVNAAGGGCLSWDSNSWNAKESAYVGDATSPTTNPGCRYSAVYNTPSKQLYTRQDGGYVGGGSVLFSSQGTGDLSNFSWYQMVGLMQDIGTHCIDRSDFMLNLGPYALCRAFVGDASTLGNCTKIMPCTEYPSWLQGAITFTLRRGAHGATPSGLYLYWADYLNNIHLAGQFT